MYRFSGILEKTFLCLFLIIFSYPSNGVPLIAPDDIATGLTAIYGFAPPLFKGNDHKIGFGFRFGNHADFQIVYELGPQSKTRTLQPSSKTRSASYRQRFVRRRPLVDMLLRAGILKTKSFDTNIITDCDKEPR